MEEQALQSTAPVQADSWFLSVPFKKNMVYEQLKSMTWTYAVGMDIGGGESMGYIIVKRKEPAQKQKESQKEQEAKPLNLDGNYNQKMLSMLSFTDQGVIIGRDASADPRFAQDFKRSPEPLDTDGEGPWDKWYTPQYRYRDLMKAFIRQLWKQILANNDEDLKKAFQEQKVLLAVGCPASPEWTSTEAMRKYQELLKEATGCEHVAVMPESTAAIMSAILKPERPNGQSAEKPKAEQNAGEPKAQEDPRKKEIDFEKGIAILDAGSSTIDFTFVLLGKVLITRSLPIGGHKLDEMMLRTALEDNGMTEEQIPEEQKQDLLLKLRMYKEDFYPKQISLGWKSEYIWERNQEGKIDRNAPPSLQLKFAMNQDFMERAMKKVFRPLGALGQEVSWIGYCREFIEQTRDLIGNYPCGKVVITGGTSLVTQWRQAVEAVYPGLVVPSQKPAAAVARGLCYAKSLEMNGGDYVEAFKGNIQPVADREYENFAKSMADYAAPIACDAMRKAAKNWINGNNGNKQPPRFILAKDLQDKTVQYFKNDDALTGETGKKKICKLFTQAYINAQPDIYKEVNKTSSEIYGSTIPSKPVMLMDTQMWDIKNLDLTKAIDAASIAKVLPTSLSFSVVSALGGIANFFGLISDDTYDRLAQRKIPRETVGQIIRDLNEGASGRKAYISRASKEIYEKIKKDEIGKGKFQYYVLRQAEIVLGKALFLVFDEQPR